MQWLTLVFVLLLVVVQTCTTFILHLNESEYERLPALFGLDDFGRCRRRGGTYCLLQADLVADPGNELMTVIHEYSAYTAKHYNYSHIDRGICVDLRCQAFMDVNKSIEAVLEACVNASTWREYGLQARVSRVHCRHGTDRKPDTADWAVAALLASIVLLNAVGTCYDFLTRSNDNKENTVARNQYLLSFSMIKNWKWLFDSGPENPQFEKMRIFNGFRSTFGFFVVFAHLTLYLATYIDNTRDYELKYNWTSSYLAINGSSLIHMYFVISGFLLVYYCLIQEETMPVKWSTVPKVMLNRLLRITPSFAVMLAVSTTWIRHLGSGPLWHPDVESVVEECRAYWWHHLILINNYVPGIKLCGLQTWHIACEIQLFFVGLVVHLATASGGRRRTLGFLFFLGLVAPALHVVFQDIDLTVATPEIHRYIMAQSDSHHKLYRLAHNNLTPYILGMASGYVVYHGQKRGVDLSKVKLLAFFEYCVSSSVFVYLMISGQMYYSVPGGPGLGVRVIYVVVSRLVVGTVMSMLVITVMLNSRETYLSSSMSWRVWMLPSKLSYSIFLNHMAIIQVFTGTKTQLGHATFLNMVVTQLGVYVLCFIAAVPLSLLVERPARLLSVAAINNYHKPVKKTM